MIKLFGSSSEWPQTPIPNSYWVEPGRLLAGEYPGAAGPDTSSRVRALLQAGVTSFIDLTSEGELPPYHTELADSAVHRRFAIVDHGIPQSPAAMAEIVNAITADLEAGRRVYVHCRAGIGRTGMTVACYLIRQGLDATTALEKLQTLWQRCARARSWPSVPETEEQVSYVRSWSVAAAAAQSPALLRAEGALLGLAIGEAWAMASENARGGDSPGLADAKRTERLATGAHTAMTRAAAESLLERGEHDPHDQLRRYLAWSQQPSAQAHLPAELKRVLAIWQWSRKPNPGSHDPNNLDPHSLARSLAAALAARGDVRQAAELAAEVSRTTQQSPLVVDACRLWGATLCAALQGATKADLLALRAAERALSQRKLKPQLAALLQGEWHPTEPRDGALSLSANALDVFRFTHSFEAAVRHATGAHAACGALIGALAGAHYGVQSVPSEWQAALVERDALRGLAARFVS